MISEVFSIEKNYITRKIQAGNLSGTSKLELKKFEPSLDNDLSLLWWKTFIKSPKSEVASSKEFNIVDLFCSVGGLSLGAFEAAKAVDLNPRTLFCADVDNSALDVYKKNFSPIISSHNNISNLVDYHIYGRSESAELAYQPEIIDIKLASLVNKVDLLIAGPPCQGHSTLNNHSRGNDPRNHFYISTAAIAIALNAKLIVIENVARVTLDDTDVVETAKTILKQAGYFLSEDVINASELGGGQTRRRHFLVATKKEHIPLSDVSKILKKDSLVLSDLIGDIELITSDNFMDKSSNTSPVNLERIKYLFDNDLYELPNEVRPDCHKDGHSYPSVYGRLRWNKPAPTITTGFLSPGRGRYIHPSQMRCITPREAARIQGFPDWFNFSSKNKEPVVSDITKWIGDAVPSVLGFTSILAALTGF